MDSAASAPTMNGEPVARSKAIQQRTGKTFHLATRLLPKRVRYPTYILYAFFRIADEVVDSDNGLTPTAQRERLERLRSEALGRAETDDTVMRSFVELRDRYGIDDDDVDTFVDAMLADIETERYATYEELEAYMDGSASAVGRMMTAVMEPDDPEAALPYATALGEAFQLSNFLRDVREDVVERERVYLPQETLDACDVSEREVLDLEMSDRFAEVMRRELSRAETKYRAGVAGIKLLPDDCQFAVLLAAVLYADHHREIRRRRYDVLSETPTLETTRKLSLLARTRWHWLWNKDPEAVFHRVSSVADHRTALRPDAVEPTVVR